MDAATIERTLHVAADDLPLALAEVHAALPVGAAFDASFPASAIPGDEPSRDHLLAVLAGGGFEVASCVVHGAEWHVHATRLRTLPDFVRRGMRLLVVGLNPSLYAADAGVGFARPGNRFWPAALAAGLLTRDRDPWDAARTGVGMTDLVKRATVGAGELRAVEYRDGLARVAGLCEWLRPGAVCFAGLVGWRRAADARADPGVQPRELGGVPVYVMPNPSGLNTHDTVASLSAHLRAAATLADGS
jgi:TDG/mug DNA glycosylase family protein